MSPIDQDEQDTDPYVRVYEQPIGRREIVPGPFQHGPGHKSLAELALESGDPSALVLFVNPHSRVPYRVQLAWLWLKRALGMSL